jgi:enoyl-CoA hydratase/carnithine racemase
LHPAIVVASVNGHALGGGVTLINVSDLAVAAEEAQIGMPEVTFGVYPAMAGPSAQLRIHPKQAAWMVLTGERISGRVALEWGLVNRCVPLAALSEETLLIARRIAGFDPVTLEYSKKALWEIPFHVSDWTAALEFGVLVSTQVKARRMALDAPEDPHDDGPVSSSGTSSSS